MMISLLTNGERCAHSPEVQINPAVTALDNVTFFAGCPSIESLPVSIDIKGHDCGILGDGGVSDLLNNSLVHSERQVFGLALDI